MKWLKKLVLCIFVFMPTIVDAGILSFNNLKTISKDKYSFTITAKDMEINYLKGNLVITNGAITKITMASGWLNKTGNNNNFYFYRSGISKGEYTIATVEVVMTGDSKFSGSDLKYGAYKCVVDNYGNYFGEEGNIVNETTYKNTCGRSKDATLKSLVPSVGSLSPNFSKNNLFYTLNVDNNISKVDFEATPNDPKAKIKSGDSCALTNYLTNCYIEIESESGEVKTYIVSVYKENYQMPPSDIKNFKVYNATLNKKFSQNVTSYNLTPDKDSETFYFTFEIDEVSYTSKTCSSNSSSCNLTITTNGVRQKYVFNVIQDEEEPENKEEKEEVEISKPEKNEDNQTTIKEETIKKEENNTTEKYDKNETETENPSKNDIDNEEEKEEKTEEPEKLEATAPKNVKEKVEEKNQFLIILCIINVFLGFIIGQFIKKRTKKK